MAKPNENIPGSINLIGVGTVIKGEIRSGGDIRIDGLIYGSVTSKAKVVIGGTGSVEGDVVCQNADISGTLKGKVSVNEMLFLKSTAKIHGDIITNKLVVEAGAILTGCCNMDKSEDALKQPERNGRPVEMKLTAAV